MDFNQKFQLIQFHFDSQGGFVTKYTFEIIMALVTSIHFNRDLQYDSGSK